MFANILSRTLNKLPSLQQVRYVRKNYQIKFAYGIQPLLTDDDYQAAVDEGKLEELKYEKVRFALPYETPSVLWDPKYSHFTKFVIKGGKRALAEDLMHQTIYWIKTIQFVRKRKLEERRAKIGDKESGKQTDGQEEDPEDIEMDPMVIFKTALKNCEPIVVTRPVKRGGATYQVPFPLSPNESEFLAIKWLIRAVLDRPKPRLKSFEEVMAQELLDAYNLRGKVIKRKDDMHKLADANKAYAHYRWG